MTQPFLGNPSFDAVVAKVLHEAKKVIVQEHEKCMQVHAPNAVHQMVEEGAEHEVRPLVPFQSESADSASDDGDGQERRDSELSVLEDKPLSQVSSIQSEQIMPAASPKLSLIGPSMSIDTSLTGIDPLSPAGSAKFSFIGLNSQRMSHLSLFSPQMSSQMSCECGNVFLDDALFCRKCGTRRPNACSCGNILRDDAAFCRKCGKRRSVACSEWHTERTTRSTQNSAITDSISLPGTSSVEEKPKKQLKFLSIAPSQSEIKRGSTESEIQSEVQYCSAQSSLASVEEDIVATNVQGNFQILPVWTVTTRQTENAPRLTMRLGHRAERRGKSPEEILDEIEMHEMAEMAEKGGKSSSNEDNETPLYKYSLSNILQSFIANPSNQWRLTWDMLSSIFICWECFFIPLQFIDVATTPFIEGMLWTIRMFWSVDLPLCFMTGYVVRDGTHEMRPRHVMLHYLRTWFVLDFGMLLTDWTVALLGSSSYANAGRVGKTAKGLRLLKMIRMTRLVRVKKLPEAAEAFIEDVIRPELLPIVAHVFKIVAFFCWLNHFIACLWYNMGSGRSGELDWINGHEMYGESQGFIYLTAYHWSLQNFQGAAQVWPWNETERLFAVIVSVLSFCFAGGFVSSLTSSMTHFEVVNSQDSQKLIQLKHWLSDNGIPGAVSLRAQRNARFALKEVKRNMPESSVELLAIISVPLQMEIHFEMHMSILSWHPFFRLYNDLSRKVMSHVCHEAVFSKNLSKGDALFVEGESPQSPRLYFLKFGKMFYKHLSGNNDFVTPGQWASEAGIWTHWVHCGTMVATSECTLLGLDAHKFQAVASQFQKELCFAQAYGEEFVKCLNQIKDLDITDLDDPEMDVEWLAMQTCPITVSQSGLVGIFLQKQKGSNLGNLNRAFSKSLSSRNVDKKKKQPQRMSRIFAKDDVVKDNSLASDVS